MSGRSNRRSGRSSRRTRASLTNWQPQRIKCFFCGEWLSTKDDEFNENIHRPGHRLCQNRQQDTEWSVPLNTQDLGCIKVLIGAQQSGKAKRISERKRDEILDAIEQTMYESDTRSRAYAAILIALIDTGRCARLPMRRGGGNRRSPGFLERRIKAAIGRVAGDG